MVGPCCREGAGRRAHGQSRAEEGGVSGTTGSTHLGAPERDRGLSQDQGLTWR